MLFSFRESNSFRSLIRCHGIKNANDDGMKNVNGIIRKSVISDIVSRVRKKENVVQNPKFLVGIPT